MTTITINVDETTKQEAQEVVNALGFDLSSVTQAFYKQIANNQSIPLNMSYEQPNKESLQAIAETEAMVAGKIPSKGYSSFSEMMKDIENEIV